MYYYIYDSFLNEKKYKNLLAKIEVRLTDLGINGKINRLSLLKNINQTVKEEVKRGIKTVVVVGNDKTLNQIINTLANLNVAIGYIPVDNQNRVAQLLGIPLGEAACDVLSARIIRRLDLGQVNNYYFLTCLELGGKDILLECDNNYFVNLDCNSVINISNLNFCYQHMAKPDDELLDLFVEVKATGFWNKKQASLSNLRNKAIKITSGKTLPILINDEKRIIKTPAEVKIDSKKLRMIVGKKRPF